MLGNIRRSAERKLTDLLATADIKVDGDRPWDIQVTNRNLFERVFSAGSLGLGEAYMDGWWNCIALDQFFFKLLHNGIEEKFRNSLPVLFNALKSLIFNRQNKRKAFEVGEQHYDAGNDLFEKMLDSRMTYSCGYWREADNLESAQEAKLK